MSLFLQIMISLWIIMPCVIGIGYVIYLSSTKPADWAYITKIINKSKVLNLFGKIFLNALYILLCPIIAIIEWLIIAMTYHRRG